jgi:hypothetical protein
MPAAGQESLQLCRGVAAAMSAYDCLCGVARGIRGLISRSLLLGRPGTLPLTSVLPSSFTPTQDLHRRESLPSGEGRSGL